MYRRALQTYNLGLRRLTPTSQFQRVPGHWQKRFTTGTASDYESKYAKKLRQVAQEKGLSVEELKTKAKEEQVEEARRRREASQSKATLNTPVAGTATRESVKHESPIESVRKDSSPIKPLSSILNTSKIMSSPHTAAQISALWTAYHASRSGGTGRGYVCAAAPLELYNKMASIGGRYPSFVVPVPRTRNPAEPPIEGEEDTAYEFYFLQWNFHDVPPIPTTTEDPFSTSAPFTGSNPPTSTILFTPLQEYKMRGTYATPYLVLTHYTDLAHTHGTVLLRGEITPASASGGGGGVDGRYMLSQEDAQLLSMAAQKFYLWGKQGEGTEAEKLLKCFHETPEDFKWEELLKHAKWTI